MASCNILLSADAEEVITSNGKLSKVSSIVDNVEISFMSHGLIIYSLILMGK